MARTIEAMDFRTGTLRARIVDEAGVVEGTRNGGRGTIRCEHGGSVANCYGYPASSEVVLAVNVGRGTVIWFANQLAANKITMGGAAERSCHTARAIFDNRYGNAAKRQARADTLRYARRVAREARDVEAEADALEPTR